MSNPRQPNGSLELMVVGLEFLARRLESAAAGRILMAEAAGFAGCSRVGRHRAGRLGGDNHKGTGDQNRGRRAAHKAQCLFHRFISVVEGFEWLGFFYLGLCGPLDTAGHLLFIKQATCLNYCRNTILSQAMLIQVNLSGPAPTAFPSNLTQIKIRIVLHAI